MTDFKQICSIRGLRVWFRNRNASKSMRAGVYSLTYYSNGLGRKVGVYYKTRAGQKIAFNLPIEALVTLMQRIDQDGPISRNSVSKRGWKLVMRGETEEEDGNQS